MRGWLLGVVSLGFGVACATGAFRAEHGMSTGTPLTRETVLLKGAVTKLEAAGARRLGVYTVEGLRAYQEDSDSLRQETARLGATHMVPWKGTMSSGAADGTSFQKQRSYLLLRLEESDWKLLPEAMRPRPLKQSAPQPVEQPNEWENVNVYAELEAWKKAEEYESSEEMVHLRPKKKREVGAVLRAEDSDAHLDIRAETQVVTYSEASEPQGAFGFRFGMSPKEAVARCKAQGTEWKRTESPAVFVCEGPIDNEAALEMRRVTVRFCQDTLCALEFDLSPEESDGKGWTRLYEVLGGTLVRLYGRTAELNNKVPVGCLNELVDCVQKERAYLQARWRWQSGGMVEFGVRRNDAGQSVMVLSYQVMTPPIRMVAGRR